MLKIAVFLLWIPVFLIEDSRANYDIKLLETVLRNTWNFYNALNSPIFISADVDADERDSLEKILSSSTRMLAKYNFYNEVDDGMWNILHNHINKMALNIVLCTSSTDSIWPVADQKLRRLRSSRMIVLLSGKEYENGSARVVRLRNMFEQLWKFQFINVIVLCDGNIYTYTPYPSISIYKVSLNTTGDLFPTRRKNLLGYKISTPVENDIPRIFCITDAKGRTHVKGFAFQIFSHFIKRLNATLQIPNLNASRSIKDSVNMSNIISRISSQDIEISMHPYTSIKETDGVIGYPVFKMELCLIVPVHNEIERFMYLLRPFEPKTWLLLFLTIIYVTFAVAWLNPALCRIKSLHQRYSRSFLESLAQVFAFSSVLRTYEPKPIYFFVSILLTVLGFLVTAFYSNLLSSFLTTFLVGAQVDTYEQAVAMNQRIMVKHYEKHMLLQQVPPHLVASFERLVVPVNASVQMTHLLSFNTSYAYPFTRERWTFLALQQQYANKPIYRYSRICFGSPTIGYPMRLDSHLEHPMTEFIMNVQMSGLDLYWLVSDFEYALKAGYVRLIDNILPFKSLDVNSLRVAWYILLGGWILSVSIFLIEHLAAKKKKN